MGKITCYIHIIVYNCFEINKNNNKCMIKLYFIIFDNHISTLAFCFSYGFKLLCGSFNFKFKGLPLVFLVRQVSYQLIIKFFIHLGLYLIFLSDSKDCFVGYKLLIVRLYFSLIF